MATQTLLPEALQGFAADLDGTPAHQACPYYTSSPAGMAWLAGAWLRRTDRPKPLDVRASKGYTIRVDGMLISVDSPSDLFRVE